MTELGSVLLSKFKSKQRPTGPAPMNRPSKAGFQPWFMSNPVYRPSPLPIRSEEEAAPPPSKEETPSKQCCSIFHNWKDALLIAITIALIILCSCFLYLFGFMRGACKAGLSLKAATSTVVS